MALGDVVARAFGARSRIGAILALSLGLAWVRCNGNDLPEVQTKPDGGGATGGAGGTGGIEDGGGGDGASEDASDTGVGDGPISAVRVGIAPIPRSDPDAGVSAADTTLAHLEVLAIGSRGVAFTRRWDGLFVDGVTAAEAEWTELEKTAALYRSSGRRVLICMALFDRTLDARPAGVTGGWDDVATRAALDALVDRTFAAFGDELAALSFGNEIDRALTVASPTDRAAITSLLAHALDYARTHPARPPETRVGVTFTADALTSGSAPEVGALLGASDVAIATYVPVDASFVLRPASTAAADLDALAQALIVSDAASPLPIFLQEVGYPSAAEAGSSLEQQRTFYDGLFQALLSRRDRFPFLSVTGLHDPSAESCAAEATALGAPDDPVALALRCSLGLRTADGAEKPAHDTVLEALATFAAP